MKLRNKKTGEIKEWQRVGAIVYGEMNEVYDSAEYNSLAELNEEWEDVGGTNDTNTPLIKDPKIRKVFREWAGFYGAERFRVEHFINAKTTLVKSTDLIAGPSIELPGHSGEDSEIYTITELCGEEEE